MHQQLAHVLQVHLSASAETTFLSVLCMCVWGVAALQSEQPYEGDRMEGFG